MRVRGPLTVDGVAQLSGILSGSALATDASGNIINGTPGLDGRYAKIGTNGYVGGPSGTGVSPSVLLDRLDRLFVGDGAVGLTKRRVVQADTSDSVELIRQINGQTYEVMRLRDLGSLLSGSYVNHQADARHISAPMKTIGFNDASVTKVGGAFSTAASTYSYGGNYYWTITAGRGGQVTLPLGTTRIGIRAPARANGALMQVALSSDGGTTWDYTKADRLPTAQQLVNDTYSASAGTLAAAITTTGQTSITTSAVAPASAPTPFLMQIDSEQMLVTAGKTTTTWTVTRGVNGTTAATHLINAPITIIWQRVTNSILVANGGPFNPSDRVFDMEPTNWVNGSVGGTSDPMNFHFLLADNLDPTLTWTIKVLLTAQRNVANTATATLNIEGFTYGMPGYTVDTQGTELLPIRRAWHTWKSALEFAIRSLPSGATTPTLIGNFHGYEREDALEFYIDGQLVTLPAYTAPGPAVVTWGSEAVVVRRSTLFHPDLGTTAWATAVVIYRVTEFGITVMPVIYPSLSARFDDSYSSMCPVEGRVLSHGWHNSDTSETTWLSQNDNRSYVVTDGAVMWDSSTGSRLALQWLLPDVRKTLAGYANPINTQYVGIQDNAPSVAPAANNSKGNKGYASFSNSSSFQVTGNGVPKNVVPGQIVNLGHALHRLGFIVEPEATLGWGT